MIEEAKTAPLPKVEISYEEEKGKYLARPGASKHWEAEIEAQLSELTDEQKAEVLRAANCSNVSLADMASHIAMLVLCNRSYNGARLGVKLSVQEFSNDFQSALGRQKLLYDTTARQITEVNETLNKTLAAVLRRADETLELIDSRANQAIESVHQRTDSGAVAREAAEFAQKEATKAIFKEIGGALKGYVKKEVESQIHRKTTFLNIVWFIVVLGGMSVSYGVGRFVH